MNPDDPVLLPDIVVQGRGRGLHSAIQYAFDPRRLTKAERQALKHLKIVEDQQQDPALLQLPRGLAESGYRTGIGAAELVGAKETADSWREGRNRMRQFYGDNSTMLGTLLNLMGDGGGTVAQLAGPGAAFARAGVLPATAPNVVKLASHLLASTPFDAAQGAGTDPEESLLGLAGAVSGSEGLTKASENPYARAATDAVPGLLLGAFPAVRQAFKEVKHPTQTVFTEVGGKEYNRALQGHAAAKPSESPFITHRTPEEMRADGMRQFLNSRGTAGFSVAADGDIRNLFNTGTAPSGTGAFGLLSALAEGGTKLDNFDTGLSGIYHDAGFRDVNRMAFADEYAPPGWDYEKWGRPDVVEMEYAGPKVTDPKAAFDAYQERRYLRTGKEPVEAPQGMFQTLLDRFDNLGAVGDVDALRQLKRLKKHLTPDELAWVKGRSSNIKKVREMFGQLPSARDMGAAAVAGAAKRGWYEESARAIGESFGPDAPRFAALLAAMSPQTSVESNLDNALSMWANWEKAGRPTDPDAIKTLMAESVQRGDPAAMPVDRLQTMLRRAGDTPPAGATRDELAKRFTELPEEVQKSLSVLPAWENNTLRALASENPVTDALSGPKVDSFMRNLLNHVDEVTLDTWMAKVGNIDQTLLSGRTIAGDDFGKVKTGKSGNYVGYSARVRETADHLSKITGETWTPAEVQETIWSYAKALEEGAGMNTAAVTDAMIADTPDFSSMFNNEKYGALLREMGKPLPETVMLKGRGALPEISPENPSLAKIARNMLRYQKRR